MERLTEKIEDRYIARIERLSNGKIVGDKMCLNKLGELEDKQEQGLLLELPVPLGTTVYVIEDDCGGDVYDCGGNCENCTSYSRYVDTLEFDCGLLYLWGKFIFATRSEAEEALAKMGGRA